MFNKFLSTLTKHIIGSYFLSHLHIKVDISHCLSNKILNNIELIFPKQKIRSSNNPNEGCVICDPGYDYWIIMENTALLFPQKISVLYKFDLGWYNLVAFSALVYLTKVI